MPHLPTAPLLSAQDLCVDYGSGKQRRRVLDHLQLRLDAGDCMALVGESGSGKSTTARALLQLLRPNAGTVHFKGQALTGLWQRRWGRWHWGPELRALRAQMQLIFQDPYACLNPRMSVAEILSEPLNNFNLFSGAERRPKLEQLLTQVGLEASALGRMPQAFSGGQRQRLGIARALALSPELLVADEPISALDVSIQAQILALLAELQSALKLTLLIVAHDLAVVRHFSRSVLVMHAGRIVESGPTDAVFAKPGHPYTQQLLAAAPRGYGAAPEPPPAADGPKPIGGGCRLAPRCPVRLNQCHLVAPPRVRLGPLHEVLCHRAALGQ